MTARWIATWLVAAMGLPGWGQSQPPQRFALTAHQVAQALSGSGVQIADEQISLLAKVVATEANPALDVLSVEPLGDQQAVHAETRSRVKLGCHLPGKCLPFYAMVIWPDGMPGREASAHLASSVSGSDVLKPNGAFTIRAGTHATMVMDDGRSHIQVAVVTLENGMAGHQIRVASPDHKQTYIAEVVSANLLRRSF